MRYDRNFKMCRAFGHQWRPTTVEVERDHKTQEKVYVQFMACGCCDTQKSVRMDPKGFIKGNRYEYPKGYQLKGRMTRAAKAGMRKDTISG